MRIIASLGGGGGVGVGGYLLISYFDPAIL